MCEDELAAVLQRVHVDKENEHVHLKQLLTGDVDVQKLAHLRSLRQGHMSGPFSKVASVRLAVEACRRGDHHEAVFLLAQCHADCLRQNMIIKSATQLAERSMKRQSPPTADAGTPDEHRWLQFVTARRSLLSEWSRDTPGRAHLLQLASLLPRHCVVLQVTARPQLATAASNNRNDTPSLLVARISGGGGSSQQTPLVAHLPAPNFSGGCVSFSHEFDSIMADNVSSMRRASSWHAERARLDARLRRLITSMQTGWLGWRSYLMAGEPVSTDSQDAQDTNDAMPAIQQTLSHIQKRHLALLAACVPRDNGHVRAAVGCILRVSVRHADCRALADWLSKRHQQHEQQPRRHHVILVLDAAVQKYPWECVWPLSEGTVSRVPCLSVLHLLLTQPPSSVPQQSTEDSTSSSKDSKDQRLYVLNPAGDLQRTERRLRPLLSSTDWQGVVGRAPSPRRLASTLSHGQLLAYMGHGSGSRYLPGELLRSLHCSATALLFGCGSGQLVNAAINGEPHGNALNYATAGCRRLLGFLWPVTDVQLDRFTDHVLTRWLANSSLCEAVQQARADAVSTMMASAGVVYGVPE